MTENRFLGCMAALIGCVLAFSLAASTAVAQAQASSVPRLPDGHPDMQGLWYKTGGFGTGAPAPAAAAGGNAAGGAAAGRGGNAAAGAAGTAGRSGAAGRGGNAGGGAAGGFGGAPADPTKAFARIGVPQVPYTPEALAELKWRAAHAYLDGEPRCHLAGVPRAAQQPPYPTQMIQDDKYLTVMYEYVHEPRIIPMDNSAHPKNYWAWDGDSRGHWEGDTLVVDVTNFNGRTWLDMEGNFVDENEHAIERFTMIDANTIAYEATITDPTVFTETWTMKFNIKRQPDKDQILEYGCLEGEQDRQHYTEEWGGKVESVVKNGQVERPTTLASSIAAQATEQTTFGCLQEKNGAYLLTNAPTGDVAVTVDPAAKDLMPPLIGREVRLVGKWGNEKSRQFDADNVRVLSEGCSWNGK